MAIKTLTYSPADEGWPSFYSFSPESMVGIDNRFFTVKNGKLYQHDVVDGANYAQFYGVDYEHYVEVVMNDSPSQNLLFKAIKLESSHPYDITIQTDIQSTGFVDYEWMEEREAAWYAFIRNSGTTPSGSEEFLLRRVGGIGKSTSYSGASGAREFSFDLRLDLKSALSVGDILYFSLPPYDTPILAGQVTDIVVDKPNKVNKIVFDDTISATTPVSIQDPFVLFAKNSIAESDGVLGHYAKIKLSRFLNSDKIEIYSIEPEVMASYT